MERMGKRIELRLDELEWKKGDLLKKIPDLNKGTLWAMIKENRIASEWSEEIAEALGVEHKWLQRGTGPKMRTHWPFKHISKADLAKLPSDELAMIEGFIQGRLQEHRQAGDKSAA